MAKSKGRVTKAKEVPVETEALEVSERLERIEAVLGNLMEVLTSEKPPELLERKGLRRHVVPATSQTALRARVGRRAKKLGYTYQEWLDRYGLVEYPPEHPEPLHPRKREQRRKKQ